MCSAKRLTRRQTLRLTAALPLGAATPIGRGVARESVDVAVIGAGLSGLVAARELVRGGAGRVRLLEARDRVGGRTVNQPIAGAVVEGGGQWVGPTQTEILALIAELGLATFPTYDVGDAVVLFSGFRLTGRGDFLEPEERMELRRAVALLETMAQEIPLDAPWTAPRAAEWDATTVADWLDANVVTPGARLELEGALASTLATTAADLSLLFFVFYLASAGGYDQLESIAGGAQEQRVVGGSHLIARRLAEELADVVALDAEVATVQEESDRVVLRLGNGAEVEAGRVIAAMSPADARRIAFAPALPASRVALMEGWRAAPGYKAHFAYDRPFWREAGLSGIALTDGVVESTFDNSPQTGSPGILLVFADPARLPSDTSSRLAALAAALVPIFGEPAGSPIDAVELDWATERYTAGCVSPLPPGLLTAHGPALRAPISRIHWAGAETADVWNGYMEGAVRSGARVAAEVLALLVADA